MQIFTIHFFGILKIQERYKFFYQKCVQLLKLQYGYQITK